MKPNINSVDINPQMSKIGHPVDGASVGAGSLWPYYTISTTLQEHSEQGLDFLCDGTCGKDWSKRDS